MGVLVRKVVPIQPLTPVPPAEFCPQHGNRNSTVQGNGDGRGISGKRKVSLATYGYDHHDHHHEGEVRVVVGSEWILTESVSSILQLPRGEAGIPKTQLGRTARRTIS